VERFLNEGKFDLLAAFAFPNTDLEHQVTCLMYLVWVFAVSLIHCGAIPILSLFMFLITRLMITLMKESIKTGLTKYKKGWT
jgi:hypothetical protein